MCLIHSKIKKKERKKLVKWVWPTQKQMLSKVVKKTF